MKSLSYQEIVVRNLFVEPLKRFYVCDMCVYTSFYVYIYTLEKILVVIYHFILRLTNPNKNILCLVLNKIKPCRVCRVLNYTTLSRALNEVEN